MTDCNHQSTPPDTDDFVNQLENTNFQNPERVERTYLSVKEDSAFNTKRYDKLEDEQLANKQQNRELRKDFAYKAYGLASACIGLWMFVIVLCIVSSVITGKNEAILSDTALGIITTGVTINVFAALLTVIKGLFTKIDE